MPKSKKKKKADFQKVKLKVGKKLSKGDNVTNLSFKTRQIQLTQTIRAGDSTLPVTKRNLSIQDLLRQCDHHSIGARVNAVSGIKELFLNNFADFLIPSNVHGYGTVMKKISSMLIDSESDVRHNVINLFKLMFSKLKQESEKTSGNSLMSGSLFSHLHAFLCCAMNHIHEDVRLDSLVLFDSLLEFFPHTMVQQTGDLLKHLISMISAPISIGTKGNTVTQRLSMNPDSKLPVMKFRARVLLRIKLTLQVALLEVTDVNANISNTTQNSNKTTWSRFFDGNNEGKKQDSMLVSQRQNERFLFIFKGAASDMQDYIIKPSSLEEFIQLSIPILLQCWKEARASGQTDAIAGNLLSPDALEVMSLVVSVIELLFSLSATGCAKSHHSHNKSQMVPTSFLISNYEACFIQDFMSYFPYSAHVKLQISKKRKLKGQVPPDQTSSMSSLTAMNLCICHIMSNLVADHSHGKEIPWMNKIQQFVIKSFNAGPSIDHCRLLTQIMENILSNPSLLGQFTPAFEAGYKYLATCKVKIPQKQLMFNLFSRVLSEWDGWKEKSSNYGFSGRFAYSSKMEEMMSSFLKYLPKLLLQVPRNLPGDVEWMKRIMSCISFSLNGHDVLSVRKEMGERLDDILDPATGLIGMDDEEMQQKVLSFLALGQALSKEQLKQMLLAIRRPTVKPTLPHKKSCSLACQAITCISRGIRKNIPITSQIEFNQMTQEQSDSLSDYLRFMFSLLIGLNREELDTLLHAEGEIKRAWKNINYSVEKEQWDRHMDITATVCQELINLRIPMSPSDGYRDTFTFISNMEQLWKHNLAKYGNVHVMSAYSLFRFVRCSSLKHVSENPSSQMYKVTANILANVLTSFYLPSTKTDKFNKEIAEDMKTEVMDCLGSATAVLRDVCDVLQNSGSFGATGEETQAASQAMEFLLSDEGLKTRIQQENLLDSVQSQSMDSTV